MQYLQVIVDGDFNPRSPYGERPPDDVIADAALLFQSTLPLRGATQIPSF